eukprot:scaffold4180_cov99-Cylindrotheca_fusiformis.AAC.6
MKERRFVGFYVSARSAIKSSKHVALPQSTKRALLPSARKVLSSLYAVESSQVQSGPGPVWSSVYEN